MVQRKKSGWKIGLEADENGPKWSRSSDFENPEIARYIHATQNSAVGTSEEKVKFMKLAWDAIGSEFASRHTQYEMFYAGAQFVTRGHALRTYGWNRSKILVDDILNSYNLEDILEEKNVAAEWLLIEKFLIFIANI